MPIETQRHSLEVTPDISRSRSSFSRDILPPIQRQYNSVNAVDQVDQYEQAPHSAAKGVESDEIPLSFSWDGKTWKKKKSLAPIEPTIKKHSGEFDYRKQRKRKESRIKKDSTRSTGRKIQETTMGDDYKEPLQTQGRPMRNSSNIQGNEKLMVRGKRFSETRKNPEANEGQTSIRDIDSVPSPRQLASGQSSGDSGVASVFSFRSLRTALSTLTRQSKPQDYVTKELSPVEKLEKKQDGFPSQMANDGDFYFDNDFDCRSGKVHTDCFTVGSHEAWLQL